METMKPSKNSLEFQLGLVSSPEDFPSRLRSLSTLDSTLRCPICKDFFQAPVLIHIPKCCHTFCSACIRTCFNNDSNNQKIKATGLGGVGNSHRCPVCKVEAQEEKIKPVPTLESAVISWQDAREEILDIIKRLQSFESKSDQQQQQQQRDFQPTSTIHLDPMASSSSTPSTRPLTRSAAAKATGQHSSHSTGQAKEQIPKSIHNNFFDPKSSKSNASSAAKKRKLTGPPAVHQDSDDDIQLLSYNPTDPSAPVQCPLCQKQMLNVNMDLHITQCLSEKKKTETHFTSTSSKPSGKRMKKSSQREQEQEGTKPNQTRIPLPHLSSMKSKEVKAELSRHELDQTGTTNEQTRRLSKYITLYNANLDAQPIHQKSVEYIREQVYLWENLQDSENAKLDQRHRKILNNEQDYLKKNKSHFDVLIGQASKSANKARNTLHSPTPLAPLDVDNQQGNNDCVDSNNSDSNLLGAESAASKIPTNGHDATQNGSEIDDRAGRDLEKKNDSLDKNSNNHHSVQADLAGLNLPSNQNERQIFPDTNNHKDLNHTHDPLANNHDNDTDLPEDARASPKIPSNACDEPPTRSNVNNHAEGNRGEALGENNDSSVNNHIDQNSLEGASTSPNVPSNDHNELQNGSDADQHTEGNHAQSSEKKSNNSDFLEDASTDSKVPPNDNNESQKILDINNHVQSSQDESLEKNIDPLVDNNNDNCNFSEEQSNGLKLRSNGGGGEPLESTDANGHVQGSQDPDLEKRNDYSVNNNNNDNHTSVKEAPISSKIPPNDSQKYSDAHPSNSGDVNGQRLGDSK